MDHSDLTEQNTGPGLCGSDWELFRRVWERVAPRDGDSCPIEPIMPMPADGRDRPGEDFPAPGEVPCLGEASAVYAPLLQEFIAHEVADWQFYQALARRATGQAARTLSAMAADERRHARRLSAAYFLISGVRFWPERPAATLPGSWMGALRQRFSEEQRGQATYLAASEDCIDPCLRALYLELAAEEASHVWLLRGILEQM